MERDKSDYKLQNRSSLVPMRRRLGKPHKLELIAAVETAWRRPA
jgi:hypothetical protein